MYIRCLFQNRKKRSMLKIAICKKVKTNCILMKNGVRVCTRFIWLIGRD
jgi:hypothetical protein